jgi:hypothetical protein
MKYFKFGLQLALGFFVAATAILILFYLAPSTKIVLLAYQFTIVAIICNWLYALVLLFTYLRRKVSLQHLLKTLGIMALNIPVGILYSYAMVFLLNYARITFFNTTGTAIPLINIQGCEQKQIKSLEHGKSETVWVKIPTECSIYISYEINGSVRSEPVLTALKKDGGLKIRYEIGSTR